MKVVADTDLADFAAQVASWLAHDPVRNNVIASVLSARLDGLIQPEDGLLLLRIVNSAGQLDGLAVRTPPQAMLVPDLSPDAIAALVDHLHQHASDVDGFNGPDHVARHIATAVAARTGTTAKLHRGLGRFTLDQVIAPPPALGRPRPAQAGDIGLVRLWMKTSTATSDRVPGLTFPMWIDACAKACYGCGRTTAGNLWR